MNLDYNAFVRLAIKITGLVFVIYALISFATYFVNFVQVLKYNDITLALLGYLIPTGVYLLLGLFLWFFPKPITNTIVVGMSKEDLQNLEIVAISLVGIVFFVIAVSELIEHIVLYRDLKEYSSRMKWLPTKGTKADIVGSSIQALLGLVLLFQGKGIARVVQKVRYMGSGK